MNERLTRNNFFSVDINDKVKKKHPTKFQLIYDQAYKQVKRKIGNQQENLPIIKMKSYQNPKISIDKMKDLQQLSERSEKLIDKIAKQRNFVPVTARFNKKQQGKNSPNEILWKKKMSMEMLKTSNNTVKFQNLRSRQLPKGSVKHLRQKTTFDPQQNTKQSNLYIQDQQLQENHILIFPISLKSKQQKMKYLKQKKNMLLKFKTTINEDFDKKNQFNNSNVFKLGKQSMNWHKNYSSLQKKKWQKQTLEKQQEEFINFVKQKTTTFNQSRKQTI